MKKIFLILLIPFLIFSQDKDEKKRKLEISSLVNTGVSYFGNSIKTNMDFGLSFVYSSDTTLFEEIEKIGFGISGSFIFDSKSSEEFRAYGDANFLDFLIYFEDEKSISTISFGFLLNDKNNMFYDDAFRIIFKQQIIENLFVSGGYYIDRDKKENKNTRHDLPIFGFSFNF